MISFSAQRNPSRVREYDSDKNEKKPGDLGKEIARDYLEALKRAVEDFYDEKEKRDVKAPVKEQ